MCSDLTDNIERLKRQLSRETDRRNILEQHTHKDNIKIIYFPDDSNTQTAHNTKRKVLDFIQNKLGLKSFTGDHISIEYRLGKFC